MDKVINFIDSNALIRTVGAGFAALLASAVAGALLYQIAPPLEAVPRTWADVIGTALWAPCVETAILGHVIRRVGEVTWKSVLSIAGLIAILHAVVVPPYGLATFIPFVIYLYLFAGLYKTRGWWPAWGYTTLAHVLANSGLIAIAETSKLLCAGTC